MKPAMILLGSMFLAGAHSSTQQQPAMSFFITSAGSGNGADLGGIAGADQRCLALADAVGAGGRQWRAYLSVPASGGTAAVHARERIGRGPWYNAKGVLVARDIEHLHSDSTQLGKENSLTEKGDMVNGRGDNPNTHDIITGSTADGMAFSGDNYDNCANYTSASAGSGSVRVGHHDRQGGGEDPTSWNSAHNSRGCSQDNLRASGGAGLFYCFAADAGGGVGNSVLSRLRGMIGL